MTDPIVLTPEEEFIVWAALLASVHDVHAAQSNLTEAQCGLEEDLYNRLLARVEARKEKQDG